MTMRQANIQVQAPGFLGLNSEQSPVSLAEGWAAIADNAVIDRNGRVSARKGYRKITADVTGMNGDPLEVLHEARYADGGVIYWGTSEAEIHQIDASGDIVASTATAAGAARWQIVTLNDDTMFFQRGFEPRMYDKSAGSLVLASAHASAAGTAPQADCAVAAYGRVWAGSVTGNRSTLYWSDLLIPAAWTGGSSGSLNLTNLWPVGNDEITAIAAHNQKLIVFGKQSILVFGSSATDGRLGDPATDLFLEDTIADIGCVGKYAHAVVGNDLWFVDASGMRSLGRTIQEKSLPIGDITVNITTEFRNAVRTVGSNTRLLYDPDEAFVLCLLPAQPLVYVFDVRQRMQDGACRVTTWSALPWKCMMRRTDGGIWFGDDNGVNLYDGYTDDANALGTGGKKYRFKYYMHPQTFGQPANLKIPKEVDFIVAGGLGQRAVAFWGYGYRYLFQSQPFILNSEIPDFYNNGPNDQYNWTPADTDYDEDTDDITEYGSGSTIGEYPIPLSGSGNALIIGFEADVLGQQLSLQEINIQTKIGRMN